MAFKQTYTSKGIKRVEYESPKETFEKAKKISTEDRLKRLEAFVEAQDG